MESRNSRRWDKTMKWSLRSIESDQENSDAIGAISRLYIFVSGISHLIQQNSMEKKKQKIAYTAIISIRIFFILCLLLAPKEIMWIDRSASEIIYTFISERYSSKSDQKNPDEVNEDFTCACKLQSSLCMYECAEKKF